MFKLKKENTKVEIELSIDNKQWEDGVQKVYENSKSKFNVEGFRKGHAPRKVIEQHYGDSVFFEDTIEYFVNETINEVLSKNPELEPVAMPTTQFDSFTVEDGLKMKIFFDIVPDFEVCDYKSAKIPVHTDKVTEEDIEHNIKHLLDANAKFESVERETKMGDSVVIDFIGFIDNVEFAGGSATDYSLELGSHTFIDNFEDQLVGHKKGETVDVKVVFPEGYGAEDLQNKEATFKCVIKEVREKTLPVLDDKFISDTTEFETIDEYKKDLKVHIEERKKKQQEEELEYNLREYLLENTKIEIPEIMIENSVNNDIKRMREALTTYNITLEDYLAQSGKSLDKYIESTKERTLKMIKTRYIYRKLIEENNIEVTAEELKENTKGLTDSDEIIRKENEMLLDKLQKFLRENVKLSIIEE